MLIDLEKLILCPQSLLSELTDPHEFIHTLSKLVNGMDANESTLIVEDLLDAPTMIIKHQDGRVHVIKGWYANLQEAAEALWIPGENEVFDPVSMYENLNWEAHAWCDYITDDLRAIWHTFTLEQKIALVKNAQRLVDDQT